MEKVSKLIHTISNEVATIQNTAETTASYILKKISYVRSIILSIMFGITAYKYIDLKHIKYFSYFFILLSIVETCLSFTYYFQCKIIVNKLMTLSLIIASLTTIYTAVVLFPYTMKDMQTILFTYPNRSSKLANVYKCINIVLLPFSFAFKSINMYNKYQELPIYKDKSYQFNFLTGKYLDFKDPIKISINQIMSILISLYNSKNALSLMNCLFELIIGYVNFNGHKKNVFMWPMIYTGSVSVLVMSLSLGEVIRREMLDRMKRVE